MRSYYVFEALMRYSQREAYIAPAKKHLANVRLAEKATNGRPLIVDLKRIREFEVLTPTSVTVRGSSPSASTSAA